MESLLTALTWISTLGAALIAGVFFGFSTFIMTAFGRRPPAEAIAAIRGVNELNIGHAIVAHALFVGFKQAVKEMKHLILSAAARG